MFDSKKRRWVYFAEIAIGSTALFVYFLVGLNASWEDDFKSAVAAKNQGHFSEAESLFKSALKKAKKNPSDAVSLGVSHLGLGRFYYDQGRWAEAEPLFERGIELEEHTFGQENPYLVDDLNTLASIYEKTGRTADAEKIKMRITFISKKPK